MKIEATDRGLRYLVRLGIGPESFGRIVDDETGEVSMSMLFGSLLSHGMWDWIDETKLAPAKRELIFARIRVAQEKEQSDKA